MLYREFGCDAVLCRPGTFNQHGHATLHSACRPCPAILDLDEDDDDIYLAKVLGRTSCDGLEIINGDVNGDGKVSPREVLWLIYVDTLGRFWGPTYQAWADTKVNECDLLGITCVFLDSLFSLSTRERSLEYQYINREIPQDRKSVV